MGVPRIDAKVTADGVPHAVAVLLTVLIDPAPSRGKATGTGPDGFFRISKMFSLFSPLAIVPLTLRRADPARTDARESPR
jgi:hypothetical protein